VKKLVTPFSVGLLATIAIGFTIWGVMRVKKGLPPGVGARSAYALFDDASGLGPRTKVVLAGVNVGQIDEIRLEHDKARVTMSIRDDAVLLQDAEVSKRQASVLGEYYLEISPGTRPPRLENGGEIKRVRAEVGLGAIISKLSGVTGTIDAIAKDVQKVTRRVAEVFASEAGTSRMREILQSTAELVRQVNRVVAVTAGKLGNILDNFKSFSGKLDRFTGDTADRVADILSRVRDISRDVAGVVSRSRGSLDTNFEQVRVALEGVKSAVAAVNRSLGHVEGVVRRVDEGKGLIGRLTSEKSETILDKGERVVEKVGDVVDNVGEVVEGVGDILDPILRLQPNFDLHTEVSALSGKIKNYVSLKLQPRPDKYYLFELVDDPRGKTSYSKRITRSTSSRSDPVVSEETTLTEDKLKFSLMLAKRWHFTTWRFGIKESSGGLGLDFHLPAGFDIQLDLFDFIGDDRPRLKTWATWNFAKYFYLTAGADDLFNSASRDYFVGMGLRFTDDDLKSLLLVAPKTSF
jgi:phospholipid/cholesterol/gamma-HCH transport system substrate-binding protein